MKKTQKAARLDPGTLVVGVGSSALGATDAEMLKALGSDEYVAELRAAVGDRLSDEEFNEILQVARFELGRPTDAEEEDE